MSAWKKRNSSMRRCWMFFSDPVSKLSTQMTRWPRSSRWSQRFDPRKPAPPVTSEVGMRVRLARLQLDCFCFEELLEPELAELAAVPRLLVSAERGERVERRAVHLNLAGADPPCHAPGALFVARPDAAGQAVDRVVGDPHGVVLVVVRHQDEHGPEDLLLGDGHVRRDL